MSCLWMCKILNNEKQFMGTFRIDIAYLDICFKEDICLTLVHRTSGGNRIA